MNKSLPTWKLYLYLAPTVGFILLFITLIIYMIFAQSFGFYNYLGESHFSLEPWRLVLKNKTTWVFFFYSLRQGIFSALGSVIIAYPLALWLKKPFQGSTLIIGFLRIPMLIPGLVAAFLFLNVIAYHGFLNEFLLMLKIIDEPLRMQNDRLGIGVVILQIWKNMPFALLLLSSSVRSISDEVLDAARDLGITRINLIRKIVLPLTLPTLRAALIIIFIGALGDFSFNVVAGPRNLQSLSQYMVTMTQQFYDVNQAAVITVLLMLAALIGVGLLGALTMLFAPQKTRKRI